MSLITAKEKLLLLIIQGIFPSSLALHVVKRKLRDSQSSVQSLINLKYADVHCNIITPDMSAEDFPKYKRKQNCVSSLIFMLGLYLDYP